MNQSQREAIVDDVRRGLELRDELDQVERRIEQKLGDGDEPTEVGNFGDVWHAGLMAGMEDSIREIESQISETKGVNQ